MARQKKQIAPAIPQARIVTNTADASSDKFMPLAEAKKLYSEGKLHELYLGNAYPNSYCYPDKGAK